MNFPYDESSLACVEDTLNLLYRASANLCTISCSNLTQSARACEGVTDWLVSKSSFLVTLSETPGE